MDALPAPAETRALILSPRTDRGAISIGGNPVRDVASRRFFQAWLPVTTRHGLYYIVKGRLARTADALEQASDVAGCTQLRQASPHWLRHTFAKSALLTGQDVRHVAALLGHRDLATTMVYTEQDALDLIRAANVACPGVLAEQVMVSPT
ncbi:tyrosine-type recombinase/integrase [Janthinobacterium lividum]